MRSANESKYRKGLNNKLTVLIMLWVFDKIIMLLMLWFL